MVGQPLSIGGCFFFLSPLLLSSLPSSVPPSPLSILPSFLSTLNFLHTVKIFSKLSTLNLHYFCNQNKHMWIKKLKMACSWKKKSSLQYSRIKSYIRKIGIRKQLCIKYALSPIILHDPCYWGAWGEKRRNVAIFLLEHSLGGSV